MANYRNYEVPEYGTLKERLAASTAQFADRPAFREKADGVWREKTYREYGEDVNALGTELLAHGVRISWRRASAASGLSSRA